MNVKHIWVLIKTTFSSWLDDYAPSMGAALAYYTLFSIAPLLLIVISTAGLVFGEDAVRGEIFVQLQDLMGDQGAQAVQSLLASVSEPKKGIAGTIIGTVLLVVGATSVLGELQDALDRIWRAPQKDRQGGLVTLIRTRLLSLGIILGIGFLLIVSLVFSAAMAALAKWWGPFFSNLEILATAVNFIFSFLFLSALFAMLYKLMPRVEIRWRDVWGWRCGDGITIYGGQASDWNLHREERHQFGIRRGRVIGSCAGMGLLFRTNFSAWSGVYQGIFAGSRLPKRPARR